MGLMPQLIGSKRLSSRKPNGHRSTSGTGLVNPFRFNWMVMSHNWNHPPVTTCYYQIHYPKVCRFVTTLLLTIFKNRYPPLTMLPVKRESLHSGSLWPGSRQFTILLLIYLHGLASTLAWGWQTWTVVDHPSSSSATWVCLKMTGQKLLMVGQLVG